MRIILTHAMFVAAIVCPPFISTEPSPPEGGWKTIKSRHIIVHHTDNVETASDVARTAEDLIERMKTSLGMSGTSPPWTWENRLHIYIYPSRETLLKATSLPTWAAAKAKPAERMIIVAQTGDGVDFEALGHELAHVVFRQWVGFEDNIPLWLDEGMAMWLQKGLRADRAESRVHPRECWPLARLSQIRAKDLSTFLEAYEFYAQAENVVDFLVSVGGTYRFLKFCRLLRTGKTVDDALRFTYSDRLRSMKELDSARRARWSAQMEGKP